MQTNDLIQSEIPKCRLQLDMKDFIIHSDVSEFQSDKVRAKGGEFQKGLPFSPEAQKRSRRWRSRSYWRQGLLEPY